MYNHINTFDIMSSLMCFPKNKICFCQSALDILWVKISLAEQLILPLNPKFNTVSSSTGRILCKDFVKAAINSIIVTS